MRTQQRRSYLSHISVGASTIRRVYRCVERYVLRLCDLFSVLVIHITAGSTQNTRPANIEANHLQTNTADEIIYTEIRKESGNPDLLQRYVETG